MSSSSNQIEPASPGEEIGGLRVSGWISPKGAGILLGHPPRTLERWRSRGLPSRGSGRSRRYPLPHLTIWARGWHQLRGPGEVSGYLGMDEALALHYRTRAQLDRRSTDNP